MPSKKKDKDFSATDAVNSRVDTSRLSPQSFDISWFINCINWNLRSPRDSVYELNG